MLRENQSSRKSLFHVFPCPRCSANVADFHRAIVGNRKVGKLDWARGAHYDLPSPKCYFRCYVEDDWVDSEGQQLRSYPHDPSSCSVVEKTAFGIGRRP
jgi:hypothetical protein